MAGTEQEDGGVGHRLAERAESDRQPAGQPLALGLLNGHALFASFASPVFGCDGVGYQRFRHGDAREIQGAVTVELGPEPEVYEIRVNVSDEQPPKIEVLGRDNARIHEDALVPEARGQILKTVFNEGFFFPSEFKPDEKERPYFLEPALAPVTDLGFLSGAAEIRLWIESDARPCMPAIYLAANYLKVTSLRYRHDNPPLIQRVTDPDTEFNRLFEPYDGSLRFYFREGIFQERVPAVSKEGLK